LAGAVLFVTPGSSWARGGQFGGGHFGGAHFAASPVGGYHGGFYHGGYHYGYGHYYPYSGYRQYYHPYYGYHHYYGAYPYYNYGYYPYYGAYPYLWSGVATDPGYAGAYAEAGPTYLDDTTPPTPPAAGNQSYYAPAAPGQPDGIAHVTVNVPPNAKVWFGDALTTSTGSVRQFYSPPLTRGSRYTYDIKASWNENGHEVTQSQHVQVTAGAHIDVAFPNTAQTAAK
jgi:uncharacterized protein (TIGR03000 family)